MPKEPFSPLSYQIKSTWSHKIFDAQIKITRHITKVLYSDVTGVAIISEVRGTEMSNVVIIINKYYNIYVCIIDKKKSILVGSEIKYTAGQ